MDDADVDLTGASAHASPDVILVSDPSAEGDAISSALRSRGFTVLDTPLAMLEARVVGESPRALVLDVDQPGAFEAMERLRELGAGAVLDLFCVGDPGRAAELGATRTAGRAFERPVDIDLLVAQVMAVAEPSPAPHPSRGTTPPPSYAPRRETAPPLPRDSELPANSDFPRSGDPLEMGSMLPGAEDPFAAPKHLPTSLSPELEQLLAAAERRVGASVHPSSIPAPEDEVDLILSPELLASLDEPLGPDEDEAGTGSGSALENPSVAAGSTHQQTVGDQTSSPATGAATSAGDLGFESAVPQPREASQTASGEAQIGRERRAEETRGDAAERNDEAPATELFDAAGLLARARTPLPGVAAGPITQPGSARAVASRSSSPGPPGEASRPFASPGPSFVTGRPAQVGSREAAVPARPPSKIAPSEEPLYHPALGPGDTILAVARAIATRRSGSIAITSAGALRRIVLHDGDIVTAGSGAPDETLVAFLAARGDLSAELASSLSGKLPPSGRHAGAALIAYGHLGQDDLWPVLRAHAEWIIGRALLSESGSLELEAEPPGRLRAEPGVFGGATGAEVFVETVRRVISNETALARLGGLGSRLGEGRRASLLTECALRPAEEELVRTAAGRTLGDVLAAAVPAADATRAEPELASLFYALVALDVLSVEAAAPIAHDEHGPPRDPLDEEAVRQRVRARLALVHEGDYFSILGIPRTATSYEVRRAYLDLRRAFEPSRLLTASTADLADDVRLVVEVIEEAYEILREPHRRERYRKAIEAEPLA